MTKEDFHSIRKRIGLSLDTLENWVKLSEKTKELMEKGLMDFDIIKEEALLALIIMQSSTAEELAEFYNPKSKIKQCLKYARARGKL